MPPKINPELFTKQRTSSKLAAASDNTTLKGDIMKRYENFLDYYLDTDKYFRCFVPWFYDLYGHFGECGEDVIYDYESEIFMQLSKQEKSDFGFRLSLPEETIYKYFTMDYSDEQLFAVIFSHWCGLHKRQIQLIADKRREKVCWNFLNFFICNKDILSPDVKGNELNSYRYTGIYHLTSSNGAERQAILSDGCFTDISTGQVYKIVDIDELNL